VYLFEKIKKFKKKKKSFFANFFFFCLKQLDLFHQKKNLKKKKRNPYTSKKCEAPDTFPFRETFVKPDFVVVVGV